MRKICKSRLKRCLQDYEINFEELKIKVRKGAILIDVRSPQEYNEGHLIDAINLPDYKIKERYVDILPNKEKEIIVYCQNGIRSKKVYKRLKKLGYKNVYNLCGGLENI